MDIYNTEIMQEVIKLKPVVWKNPHKDNFYNVSDELELKFKDIIDADKRLRRFAPLVKRLFPETGDGIIESPLLEIPSMKMEMKRVFNRTVNGRLYLKCDSHLKIAGSIKARGGIYEVLKHAEELAVKAGRLSYNDDYTVLANDEFKRFFSGYKIAVGSTGNLGLSIGIMASALGFQVTVHMSRDAKQWKKELLREKGAVVVEHEDDYSRAVEQGRKECEGDPSAYFIDDENSRDLFLGYSAAALRLKEQLDSKGITIDENHRLYVYLPCGVGGAPGGITFGLKYVFGDNVHCFFVEPTHSPCMLMGLLTQRFTGMHIREYGIDNITEADGLAVGSPSRLVAETVNKLIDGEYTVDDDQLFVNLSLLWDSEKIKIEPSAASSLSGPAIIEGDENSVHISWATGGLLLPENMYSEMYQKGANLLEKL